LDILFLVTSAGAAMLGKLPVIPDWAFLPLLGLAAYRGGRAIAYNFIFKWLRDLVGIKEVDDSSGAGQSNEPAGKGVQHALGELLCCPICSGTWVGVGLLIIYALWAPVGAAVIYALAAAGIAEVLDWMSEFLFWKGRAAREEAGDQWLYKNRPEVLRDLDERRGGGRD
jgi:hypothetical protein